MFYETIDIAVATPGKSGHTATLTAYVPDSSIPIPPERLRPAVLICPGGGYEWVSAREGEPIALDFAAAGVCAFVLNYSCAPARFPQALCEALTALAHIRENAEKFFLDPNRIAVCGFSAGGHLAASVGVFWNNPLVSPYLKKTGESVRPNKLILAYPVILSQGACHQDSFRALLGEDGCKDAKLLDLVSLDKQVTAATPPTFLWHTAEDALVPVQNSLAFASAVAELHIPVELHIYPKGPHGLSLGDQVVCGDRKFGENHMSSGWFREALRFLFD